MSKPLNQRYEKGRNLLHSKDAGQPGCINLESLDDYNNGLYPIGSAAVDLCIENGLASIVPEEKTPAQFIQVWQLARKGFYWDIKTKR